MKNLNIYKFWSLTILFLGMMMIYLSLLMLESGIVIFIDWEVISLNSCIIIMTMLFDWMSLMFLGCVLLISCMVVYYSTSYMSYDLFKSRFLFLILLFILSMGLLIISPNLISILLGWDGLGLISYCLVIYFQNYKSYNSGMQTILINRVGDVAILIAIAWMLNSGSWNFIYYLNYFMDWMFWVITLIILASFTKSAQLPFSSWLPAAMAAPTPVSALVHSSTLVTAGVYLLIRFSDLFLNYNLNFFLLMSCLTMFMAGLNANFEYDLKKIIALSTLSQLGMMVTILFMGYPLLAYLHLLTHAFFKALLFLCAGLIIHSMEDTQDIRHMGVLMHQLPFTSICFSISSLSLCGFPFLAGFYSKDLILEYMLFNYNNMYLCFLFYISIGLTMSYSARLIYYCMGENNGLNVCCSYKEDFTMILSMLFLTFMAIISGSFLSWLILPYPDILILPLLFKLFPLLFVFLGGMLGYKSSQMNLSTLLITMKMNLLLNFMSLMWFMPMFNTYMIYYNFIKLSKYYFNIMDMGWGEYFMSKSFMNSMTPLIQLNTLYQNNNIKFYMISFLFCMIYLIMM